MPNPRNHDQPVEGSEEVVEHTLQKQQAKDPKGQQKSKEDQRPQSTKSKPPSR